MTRVAVGAERSRARKRLDEARKEMKEKEAVIVAEAKSAEERWNQERCSAGIKYSDFFLLRPCRVDVAIGQSDLRMEMLERNASKGSVSNRPELDVVIG